MSKFISWQLKRWLLPILIITSTLTLTVVFSAISEPVSYLSYCLEEDNCFVSETPSTLFFMLIIYSSLMAFIFPLIMFNYKFGIRRADFYKQLPFKPKQLRRTIFLLGLTVTLVCVSIIFALCFGIYALRYFATDITKISSTAVLIDIQWKYLGYFYLLLIGSTFSTFSLHSLFVFRNANIFEGIVAGVLAQVLLNLLPFGILSQVAIIYPVITGETFSIPSIFLGVAAPAAASFNLNQLFTSSAKAIDKSIFWNVPSYLLFGLGSFLYLFMEKDRSSDIENERGRPSAVTLIALHGGFLAVLLMFDCVEIISLYVPLILWTFTTAIYYFINVLFAAGFKFKLSQWLPFTLVAIIAFAEIFILNYFSSQLCLFNC